MRKLRPATMLDKRWLSVMASVMVVWSVLVAAGQPATARPTVEYTVNTMPLENGSVCCFGGRGRNITFGINTVGQTIQVPARAKVLRAFAFRLHGDRHLRMRGYVYRWSPAKQHAVGDPLYRSPLVRTAHDTWKNYRFRTGELTLKPGRWYVAFISVSENRVHVGAGGSYCSTPARSLPGKQVRMSNGYHERQWTRKAWKFDAYLGDMCMKLRSTN